MKLIELTEHCLEMDNLEKLTDDEIKELLPNISERHRLKDAIDAIKVKFIVYGNVNLFLSFKFFL